MFNGAFLGCSDALMWRLVGFLYVAWVYLALGIPLGWPNTMYDVHIELLFHRRSRIGLDKANPVQTLDPPCCCF